ncbi:MAG: Crp/Fnr family transcriptional regulator [Deltaproteobacteria bacterium]|nr:Crp/Fnr family transcriptional regulator [Deltaproteobacteria bacterium]
MENFLSVISSTPLFKGLPQSQLEKIEKIAVKRNFGKGELIFSEGDESDGFYIVAKGMVKIYKVSLEGKEQILHIFGQGEPFGEVPVFSGSAFPANAQAIEKCSMIFFPRDTFVQFISENIPVVLNMLGLLSMRLRQFTVQIENLSLKEVPGRLAGYLLLLAEEQQNEDIIQLNISKGQLASLLGTIPETLSRIFSKMNDMELIEVKGRNIKILDSDEMEDLAEHGKI